MKNGTCREIAHALIHLKWFSDVLFAMLRYTLNSVSVKYGKFELYGEFGIERKCQMWGSIPNLHYSIQNRRTLHWHYQVCMWLVNQIHRPIRDHGRMWIDVAQMQFHTLISWANVPTKKQWQHFRFNMFPTERLHDTDAAILLCRLLCENVELQIRCSLEQFQ